MKMQSWLLASAVGSAGMFVFDPRSGRRRRHRIEDRLTHVANIASRGVARAARDLEHRSHGALSEIRAALVPEAVDDGVVVSRVRSRLGRVSAAVHAVGVSSMDGVVELTGSVPEVEAAVILQTARTTMGVHEVVDRLERLSGDDRGRASIERKRSGFWRPGTRLLVGAASSAVALVGAARGGAGGALMLATGLAGSLHSLTNRSLGELVGLGRKARGIAVNKTITIGAPVEDVYRILTSFEDYVRFMPHVEHVAPSGDRRWRWKVAGPAGRSLEWEARLIRVVPNELIAWTTAEGASVESTGSVRFERAGQRGDATRVSIRMTYRPPAGLVGHEIATLLGAAPRKELDAGMLRLKAMLEVGRPTTPPG